MEPGFYNNKDLILDEIWALLSKGVKDRNEDFRLPVVVLNSKQGPDARIVVLASASLRRLELLQKVNIIPEVVQAAEIDETPKKKEKPIEYCQKTRIEKLV